MNKNTLGEKREKALKNIIGTLEENVNNIKAEKKGYDRVTIVKDNCIYTVCLLERDNDKLKYALFIKYDDKDNDVFFAEWKVEKRFLKEFIEMLKR